MAIQPITGEVRAFPGIPPAAAGHIARKLLNRHSAHEIAEAIEVLVDLLDCLGGDPEAEDDDPAEAAGDEQDGTFAEDEKSPLLAGIGCGAGCPIADPGGCEHDGLEPEVCI